MEGHELLAKMTKVEAPAGFEEGVLARLPAARAERARSGAGRSPVRVRRLGRPRPRRRPRPQTRPRPTRADRPDLRRARGPARPLPAGEARARGGSRPVPVYETMDYASEYRNARPQPQTVYILEQVSETVPSEIIY
ncbi:MAG: hypothetical protein M0C28_02870 [Candidatus Moduliflexus flocculans]|nr:hypothetical protein [Candidatus Moduliflexus flocculans]